MSRLLTRLSTLLFGLFVVGGLAFGVQALDNDPEQFCLDDMEEIGFCPPLDDVTCTEECFDAFGEVGSCERRSQETDKCCVCEV